MKLKPPAAYTLGLLSGIALTVAFFFWSHRRVPAVITPHSIATTHSASKPPPPAAVSGNPLSPLEASASSTPSLESALREISEAGMVVIPQEFIRFLSPSLFGSYPNPAVREVLKLDEREVSAFVKEQGILFQGIEAASGKHLKITGSSNGVLSGVLPAFPEERQKMVDNYRNNLSASLDAESAALFANIDLAQALAFHTRVCR